MLTLSCLCVALTLIDFLVIFTRSINKGCQRFILNQKLSAVDNYVKKSVGLDYKSKQNKPIKDLKLAMKSLKTKDAKVVKFDTEVKKEGMSLNTMMAEVQTVVGNNPNSAAMRQASYQNQKMNPKMIRGRSRVKNDRSHSDDDHEGGGEDYDE